MPNGSASQDWSTEHPCDESREQCGLPRPPGLCGDPGGTPDADLHAGRGSSGRHRGSGVDAAGIDSSSGGAHHNGIPGQPQDLKRSSTHPAVSPQSTVKTRSAPRRASTAGIDSGGGVAEPQRQSAGNALRQRSLGWGGEAAHGDGAATELRRGSLPDMGGSRPHSSGGASPTHQTSWHGQQQQITQMLARGAPPPPPPPPAQQQQQRFSGLLAGQPPPPPPREQSPHARAALAPSHSNGAFQREPMVPFGSPALRSRLAYGSSNGSPSNVAGSAPPFAQAGAYGDSPLNLLMQVEKGLDAEIAAEGQARLHA